VPKTCVKELNTAKNPMQQKPAKNLSEQSELSAKNLPKTRQKSDKPQSI
jgi:hypothetical protein